MNNKEFEKLHLNKFKPDNSYESLLKRVKEERCSKIAEELYAAYSINEVKDKRIIELEKYLQKVQADRINDIAIERKRWARADFVALEILRLEQQAKALDEFQLDENVGSSACAVIQISLDVRVREIEIQIKALKEPKQ
jgi:hypothetical protein